MHKRKKFYIRIFATYVAISFLYTSIFVLITYFGLNNKITKYSNLINTVAINQTKEEKEVSFDNVQKKLTSYPSYGSKYGNIVISKVNIKLPLYYGDTPEILSYGAGQYAASYFPGETGTTIIAAHNDKGYFEKLLEVKENDIINIETNYGKFNYQVYKVAIVNENNNEAFEVQNQKDALIAYTCYPLGIGKKTERYVVYAIKVGDNNG